MALRVEERIVSGGREDALIVHHLVLRGSNRAIGRHLGEIARSRYHLTVGAATDRLRVRAQREWLRRNAPVLFERMRGAAEAFGVDLRDDAADLSRLGVAPVAAGSSAVYLPAQATTVRRPLVSCAFDLAPPAGPGAPGAPDASLPYVIETYPDEGLPALALVAFDLLGAVLDGLNGAGLCVVAVADLESAAFASEPDPLAVGLDELQLGRALLDGCASAREASALLLSTKHHYAGVPTHWLVADRHGDAFVFELSRARNRGHLVEAAERPLVVTNHPLHRYPRDVGLPRDDGPSRSYARLRQLRAALADAPPPWSPGVLAAVASRAFSGPPRPERTLWHGIYDPGAGTLEATFLIGDARDPEAPGGVRPVRTPPLRFQLAA